MPDIREVYEMITKHKPAAPGALVRLQRRQVRTARNRRIGGYAVGAVFVAAVVIGAILVTQQGENQTTPAERPPAPGAASGPFLLDLHTPSGQRSYGPVSPGEKTPLPGNLAGGYAYVASPDGTRVAYGSSRGGGCSAGGLTIANIDGTGVQTFDPPEDQIYCAPRWSPDGSMLIYQGRADSETSVGNLFLLDVSTGRTTQVTDLELSDAWWWFLFPSFSLDGESVIYHFPRTASQRTQWDVWSVPVTGGEPTLRLRNASFPMLNPTPGPDGDSIKFLVPGPIDFAGQRLMTGRPDPRSDLRSVILEANASIWWPTQSPDGNRIAYQDGGSIFVVDAFISGSGEPSKVAEGETAEWLDNDTLIVAP